jgi:hypothetical protein
VNASDSPAVDAEIGEPKRMRNLAALHPAVSETADALVKPPQWEWRLDLSGSSLPSVARP